MYMYHSCSMNTNTSASTLYLLLRTSGNHTRALRYSEFIVQFVLEPSPATSATKKSFDVYLIHFSFSLIHFKVGCRQSKINSLLNLVSLCL